MERNDCKNETFKTELYKMNCCRVCVGEHVEMADIFNKDADIVDRILFCTGILFTKEDNLPGHICNSCLNDLSVAHRFKTSCMLANTSFRKLTRTNIKTEVNGDDYSNDYDVHDDVTLKEEIINNKTDNDTGDCVKHEAIDDDSKPDWLDSNICTKQKKRAPHRKNGKTKRDNKDAPPKVKKKSVTKGPLKKKTDPADQSSKQGAQRLRCAPCGLVFESRALADAHRESAHKGDAQYWVCEMCGQTFAHRGSLSTHIRSHYPPAFACAQCSYRAAHKYDLTKHQRIHAGERPFQCDMCPASFYDASNMNSHIRRNHQKLMNFKCEVCGRGFYDRSKLNRHVDSHNNIKRHVCSECGAAFTRLSYLKTHLRKRHGVQLPPLRPGPPRKNLIVDAPPVEYVKPTLIAVKQDAAPM